MSDSRVATYQHISLVQAHMAIVIADLQRRQMAHDQSKLASPEREAFDEFGDHLARAPYGTPAYEQAKAIVGEALKHHYAVNDHHPEHYVSDAATSARASKSTRSVSATRMS
jgi:hypothetical protein